MSVLDNLLSEIANHLETNITALNSVNLHPKLLDMVALDALQSDAPSGHLVLNAINNINVVESANFNLAADLTLEMSAATEYNLDLGFILYILVHDPDISTRASVMQDIMIEANPFILNQRWSLTNTYPAQNVKSQDLYSILRGLEEKITFWRFDSTAEALARAADLVYSKEKYTATDLPADDITLWAITWEQTVRIITGEDTINESAIPERVCVTEQKTQQDQQEAEEPGSSEGPIQLTGPAYLPSDDAGLFYWLDPSDTDTVELTTEQTIMKLKDKSGHNYDAIQDDPFYRPSLIKDGVNELPFIEFLTRINSTRSHYLMIENAPQLSPDDLTLFAVIKPATVSGNIVYQGFNYAGTERGWALGRGPGHHSMGDVSDNSLVFGAANTADNFNGDMLQFSGADTSPINQLQIITVIKQANVINAWVNDNKVIDAQTIIPPNITYPGGTEIIFSRSISTWVLDYIGLMGEQIAYSLAIDEFARKRVLNYLTDKWL